MDAQAQNGQPDHFCVFGTGGKRDQCAAEELDHCCDQKTPNSFRKQRGLHAETNSVILRSAPVLSHVDGSGMGQVAQEGDADPHDPHTSRQIRSLCLR